MMREHVSRWLYLLVVVGLCASGTPVEAQPFSIVLLPDTQYYSEKSSYGVYPHQTQWIVNNQALRNIKFVVHLGDITNNNTATQWQTPDQAHALLDSANIPYSMVNGNHDLFPSAELYKRNSLFSQYFGPQRFSGRPWYGGAFDATNENNYFYFESGSLKFMVVSVEFAPRKEVVTWANQIIQANSDRRVIVATHCHSNRNGDHATGSCGSGYNVEGRDGVDLWEEMIQRHSNIFLMLSGHIQGVSYRLRTGLNGNPVHEILTDYQQEPVRGTGTVLGNGWLRVLRFDPATNQVTVETLSVEAGNFAIFTNGTPEFYLNYNQIANPTPTWHNQQNYAFSYNLQGTVSNTYTVGDVLFKDRTAHKALTGTHFDPRVASAPNGNFVMVWEDDNDGNGVGQIYARAYDKDGNALFADKTVNSVATGQQQKPDVAVDDAGNFVVVWEDDQNNDGSYDVMARGFNANGTEKFHDMFVSTVTTGQQQRPAVAVDADGDFVVAFEDDQDGNGFFQILARGFTPTAAQRFATITVNTVSSGQQFKPAIAADGGGRFTVAWEDDQEDDGKFQIFARGFNATGTQRFADLRVNTQTGGQHGKPAVGIDQSANCVVTWEDDSDNNGSYQILARGYTSAGVQRIAEFTVNSNGNGQQYEPTLAMDTTGDFVVAWEDDNDGNGLFQIMGRGFYANGSQRKADFTVNSDSDGQQYVPASGLDEQDRFVIGWQDNMDGDANFLILARNLAL